MLGSLGHHCLLGLLCLMEPEVIVGTVVSSEGSRICEKLSLPLESGLLLGQLHSLCLGLGHLRSLRLSGSCFPGTRLGLSMSLRLLSLGLGLRPLRIRQQWRKLRESFHWRRIKLGQGVKVSVQEPDRQLRLEVSDIRPVLHLRRRERALHLAGRILVEPTAVSVERLPVLFEACCMCLGCGMGCLGCLGSGQDLSLRSALVSH
mmetsp:Transcript_23203/g.53668  ORF Transcript_23203/g.53668 Transcript_23203/m.53668 type:complete len:204 (-) Transcript_23203:518-1129(-)